MKKETSSNILEKIDVAKERIKELETMINHAISVKKYTTKSLLVFDMPFNTYNNIQDATKNVKYILKTRKSAFLQVEQ